MTNTTLYWGTAFCQTDIGGLWTWAKVRPWWYWELCRIKLWTKLVWRRYEPESGRFSMVFAWGIASIAYSGLTGPCAVHRRWPAGCPCGPDVRRRLREKL